MRIKDLSITLASDDEQPEWDAFVSSRPDATAYHLFAWKHVAERAYEMRTAFLTARDGSGVLTGVLPLFRIQRPLGAYWSGGVFGAYGPLLASHSEGGMALLDAAKELTKRDHASYLHLKFLGEAPRAPDFQALSVWVIARRELPSTPEKLFSAIGSPMRNKIRKAEKNGLEVHWGRAGFEDFYEVLATNMHHKGSPMYGRPFLRELLDAMGSRADILLLRQGSRAISGALALWVQGVGYVPFASSLPDTFHLKPNNLLFWELLRRSVELGMHTFDFGTSLQGASTLEFKLTWGAQVQPVRSLLFSPGGKLPTLEPSGSAAVQSVIKLWQRLPRSIVDALGPRVIRWVA